MKEIKKITITINGEPSQKALENFAKSLYEIIDEYKMKKLMANHTTEENNFSDEEKEKDN
ncbi:hypothetical protein ACT3HK_13980 [Thermolongibacillus altinsuensis]